MVYINQIKILLKEFEPDLADMFLDEDYVDYVVCPIAKQLGLTDEETKRFSMGINATITLDIENVIWPTEEGEN